MISQRASCVFFHLECVSSLGVFFHLLTLSVTLENVAPRHRSAIAQTRHCVGSLPGVCVGAHGTIVVSRSRTRRERTDARTSKSFVTLGRHPRTRRVPAIRRTKWKCTRVQACVRACADTLRQAAAQFGEMHTPAGSTCGHSDYGRRFMRNHNFRSSASRIRFNDKRVSLLFAAYESAIAVCNFSDIETITHICPFVC